MVLSAAAKAARAAAKAARAAAARARARVKAAKTPPRPRRRVKLPPKVGSVTQKKAEARAMGRIQKKYGLQGIKITPDIVKRIAREEALTRHLERKYEVKKLANALIKARAKERAGNWAKRRENDFLNKYGAKKVYGISDVLDRELAKAKLMKKKILDKDKADILKGVLPPAQFKLGGTKLYRSPPGRVGGGPPSGGGPPKKGGFGYGGDRTPKKRRNLLNRKYAPWFAAGGFGTALGVRGYIDYHEEQKKKKKKGGNR